eukprot:TRINITY_DN509_c0_g1_i1.p1 TRINITY_DN509_c0_g1~~TRINITY_DN509_c0_g1_i1.p1  ORF type:complete len:517 (-),score=81.74 TRINITY_DN509_c0_g1_i1:855-2297(-)
MAVLYGLFVTYGTDTASSTQTDVNKYWPFYTDVSVMIFVGFGFLMTFMQKHAYSAVGFTYLIAAFCVQWAMLCVGFMDKINHVYFEHAGSAWSKISLTTANLIDGQFAAGSVMICFGALIGKVSPAQMFLVAFIQIMVYAVNFVCVFKWLLALDIGGSMTIHLFGAYFGLAVTPFLSPAVSNARIERAYQRGPGAMYNNDVFAMIGTVFLWCYWPSFNAALAPQQFQLRAVTNTLLSLCSCCVTTFLLSRVWRGEGKYFMVDVQNATLAGGVAAGSAADMILGPGPAMAVGMAAALVSTLGFAFVQPFLEKHTRIRDTCGVHNLHGMPALLGGVTAALASWYASTHYDEYGISVYAAFFKQGGMQVAYQFAAIGVSLGFGLVGGALTGVIVRALTSTPNKLFTDAEYWETPEDFDDQSLYSGPGGSDDGTIHHAKSSEMRKISVVKAPLLTDPDTSPVTRTPVLPGTPRGDGEKWASHRD